jgi:predicted PurR-regulated permease PerM
VTAQLAPWLSPRRVAAVLVLVLTVWLIRSFIVPLIWATIFAVSNWPLYRRSAQYWPKALQAHVVPLLFAAFITLLVLVPIVFAFAILAEQTHAWLTHLTLMDQHGLTAPSWFERIPLVGGRLEEYWNSSAGAPGGLASWLKRADGGSLLRSAQSIGQFVTYHLFVAAVTIVVLFSLFRHGELLAALLARRIRAQFGEPGIRYLGIGVAALRGTVNSMVLVGLVDGVLLGLVYALVHVPSAAAWGVVTGVLAILPFMGYFAVATVCVSLLDQDAAAFAAVVGVAGVAILFTSDKFVRSALMAREARLNFLGALAGTLGGVETFGLIGAFLGPVVIALGEAVWTEWLRTGEKA